MTTNQKILKLLPFILILCLLCSTVMGQYLQISENRHFLVKDNGDPFFWLGDTAWELFHRLDRNDIDYYLQNRSEKGFTVIQAVLLGEIDGLTTPNREGNLPLQEFDPTRPDSSYFALVDYTLEEAAELGLYVALLPTWGSHAEDIPHTVFDNMHIFTEENAYQYGYWLGKRYRDSWNVVWVLGGDRPADTAQPVWEAMAHGLKEGCEGKQLISYHPRGPGTSSVWLHEKEWLDFNMVQTGHFRPSDAVYNWITNDYQRSPVKPVINAEPAYEDIPQWFNPINPRYDAYQIRKLAYWSVFAGAFGHTYGNNNIWQMYRPEYRPMISAHVPWQEALDHPGAGQMKYLRTLLESRPYLSRIPDQSLIIGENPAFASDRIQATRDGTPGANDATYLMLYLPLYQSFTVKTDVIDAEELRVWWYSPVNGEAFSFGEITNEGEFSHSNWSGFLKDTQLGPDWVIVIEDASRQYPPPGSKIIGVE